MAGHVVKVSVTAETKKFSTAFRNLKNETGLTSLQNAATTAISTMAKVAAAASAALVAASVKTVGMAADLEQSTGAIEAVFKTAAATMKDYAATAATNVGLARNEYQELATLLGSQLKNGGTPIEDLAGKTNDLIKTAADLSAMFGGTTADAVAALSSALKGERNPIERYGVSLTQAAVDAKAAELGFSKVNGALSTEANQAATLALIMEQTADAHGAFARENDTLAHQLQVIKAKLTDAATAFGTLLLPAATAVATFLNENMTPAIDATHDFMENRLIPAVKSAAQYLHDKLAPAFDRVAKFTVTTFIPTIERLYKWLATNLPPAFKRIKELIKDWGPAIAGAAAAAGVVFAAFSAWAKITAIIEAVKIAIGAIKIAMIGFNAVMAANPIGLVAVAVAALVGGFIALYQHSETFRNIVAGAWEGIKAAAAPVIQWATTTLVPRLLEAWEAIKAAAAAFMTYLGELWSAYGVPLLDAIITFVTSHSSQFNGIWEGVKTIFTGVWQVISSTVTTVIGVITGVIKVFTGILSGDWAGAWEGAKTITLSVAEGIKGLVSGLFQIIGGIFRTGWNTIALILSSAGHTISTLATHAMNRLKAAISKGITAAVYVIRNFPTIARNALSAYGDVLWTAGANIIQGFINGIKSMIGSVKSTLSDLTSLLPEWKGPADLDRVLLTKSGQLIIGGLITGMRSQFGAVKGTLNGLTGMIGDTSIPALSLPGAPLSSTRAGGAVINVYTLTPTLETGRAIAAALAEYDRMNGGRR